MNRANEGIWPGVIFLSTWWALAEYTPFGGYSFFIAILFWLVGLAVIKFLGQSHFRLGLRGWLLTLQVGVWFGLFLYFFPADLPPKILALWGIGVPLIFAGAAARWLAGRFPSYAERCREALAPAFIAGVILSTLVCWMKGPGFWVGLFATLAISAMVAIPLYYGWQYAKPLPRGERDARFGSDDSFREAGMSDER
jgi:hypothetical protein